MEKQSIGASTVRTPGDYCRASCTNAEVTSHKSGWIVIDVKPELKMALYAPLAPEGMSMKHWYSQVASFS